MNIVAPHSPKLTRMAYLPFCTLTGQVPWVRSGRSRSGRWFAWWHGMGIQVLSHKGLRPSLR